jgi:hypothetical protein
MKKKISKIDTPTPSVNKAAFQPLGELPSTETANDLVLQITGQQVTTEIAKLKMAEFTEPKGYGRPIKEKAIGRVKFTTAIRKDVVKWVKHYAVEADETPADVLENALLFYMDYKKSLKG